MSHFVANNIQFNKECTEFRVKGGDNNLVPRSNYWSNWLSIEVLFYNLEGGMIKINTPSTEIKAFIINAVRQYSLFYKDAEWDNNYYSHYKKRENLVGADKTKFEGVSTAFINHIKVGLKNLNKNKFWIIENSNGYVAKNTLRKCYSTYSVDNAKKFTKEIAIALAGNFNFSFVGEFKASDIRVKEDSRFEDLLNACVHN